MKPNFPCKNRLCSVGLVMALVLLPLGTPLAQAHDEMINPAVLVKDSNTATRSAEPHYLSAVGNRLLFAADDGINGANLWAADVTGTGAFRLKAIQPLSPVVMSKGVGYFAASDVEHGVELWRTDGTSAGTQLVADINPGVADAYPHALAHFNGSLYFFATKGNSPSQFWKSDGTAADTVLITDRTASGMTPYLLAPLNGKLFMVRSVSGKAFELWISDGTDAGTRLLKAFSGGNVSITAATSRAVNIPIDPPFNPQLTEVNGTVFFYADDGRGIELWKTDGTSVGTIPATDLKPATATSSPVSLTEFQDALFFITADGLWKSQGTGASAQLVKPGPFAQLVVAGNLLFSIGTDGEHGRELWRSDGTSAGTFLVKDIYPGPNAANIGYLTALNGKLLFEAQDDSRRLGLWQSDGTAAGTTLVKDNITLYNAANAPFTVAGGRLFFLALDDQHGIELWRSDGTAAGTMLVDDINRLPEGSQPGQFIPIGERLFFTAQSNTEGRYLWRSDGTSEGTQRIDQTGTMDSGTAFLAQSINTDLYVVSHTQHKLWRIDSLSGAPTLLLEVSNAWISALTAMNNRLFFLVGGIEPQDSGLWQSDGTVAGTQLVKAVEAFPELFVHNNTIYFAAYTAEAGTELWKSDGTTNGTMLLKDINPGEGSAEPKEFSTLNGTLFFNAADGSNGAELWQSDGTTAGTVLVKDINPGAGSANPRGLINVNGALLFNADDGNHGTEPWKSDGTGDGTVFVKDIYPGPFGSVMLAPTIVNNRLFFISDNSSPVSYEVWVSDGTEAGTFMLKNILPDNHPTTLSASWLTPLNDKLLFVANDVTTNGEELWVSDGTTAGTQLLKDINPGPAHAAPGALTNVNGVVLFGATDGSGQRSLWRSDGTAAGTQVLQAIAPQPDFVDWRQPAFVVAGNNIFFSADNGTTGAELWKIPLTPNQATLKTLPLVSVATNGVGQLQIDYGNQSNDPQRQVSLTAVLDPKLTYLGSSGPVTPTVQGNTLVWQLPDLAPLAAGIIELRVQTPTAPLGARYPITLTLATVTGDAAPVQNVTNVEVMLATYYYLPVIKR